MDNLRRSITHEAFLAMGLRADHPLRWLLLPLIYVPTRRFAEMAANYDAHMEQDGPVKASQWLLPRFAEHVYAQGVENIPPEGPIVIASNHPGAFDGMVILSLLPRSDIRLIVSDVPFLRGLTAASQFMIYSTGQDMQERMGAVRTSLRHLKAGGALMLFATGVVDPDPAFMQGAKEALADWSPSLEFFLQKIPDVQLLPAIISGVLAPRFLNHPLARRQPTLRKQQKVAEYLEMIQMMALRQELGMSPAVSFGKPVRLIDLECADNPGTVMDAIQQSAQQLLAEHVIRFHPV